MLHRWEWDVTAVCALLPLVTLNSNDLLVSEFVTVHRYLASTDLWQWVHTHCLWLMRNRKKYSYTFPQVDHLNWKDSMISSRSKTRTLRTFYTRSTSTVAEIQIGLLIAVRMFWGHLPFIIITRAGDNLQGMQNHFLDVVTQQSHRVDSASDRQGHEAAWPASRRAVEGAGLSNHQATSWVCSGAGRFWPWLQSASKTWWVKTSQVGPASLTTHKQSVRPPLFIASGASHRSRRRNV